MTFLHLFMLRTSRSYEIPRLLKDENLYEVSSYFKLNCKMADIHLLLEVILSIKIYCTWYGFKVKISSRLLLIRTRKFFPGFVTSRSWTFVSFLITGISQTSAWRNRNLCSPPNKGAGMAPHAIFLFTLVIPSKQVTPNKLSLGTLPSQEKNWLRFQLEMLTGFWRVDWI